MQGKKAQPLSAPLALPGIDLTAIVDAVADRLSVKLQGAASIGRNMDEPLLLTIEQAAKKLGRTVSATERWVSGSHASDIKGRW